MKTTVILISRDEELFRALRRALKTIEGMTVLKVSEESFKNRNKVILIAMCGEDISEILYEWIRSRYLNPVVVAGFEEREVFFEAFPLFSDHPYNHNYLRIPFGLLELIGLTKASIPISSQAVRVAICGGDQGYKGYLSKLVRHDLLKDKAKCLQILSMAKAYVNDKELSIEIEIAARTIDTEVSWAVKASEIGSKLQCKIKDL